MTRSFVTGGSGFLGRNLIAELRAQRGSVRALARSDRAIAAVRAAGAEPVRGDLDDVEAMTRGMIDCDVVYHAAADVAQFGDFAKIAHINVGGTERVIAAARAAKVKRLVHVSTEAVLVGGPPIVRAVESRPRPVRPIGVYPTTKGMAEERVLAANSPELSTMIARPRFIWGVGDTSVLPILIAAVHSGRFRWIGGGRHKTSSCHIKNCCAGLIACAERGRGGEIYFLSDGEDVEVRSFLTGLLETQGVTPSEGGLPFWLARATAWTAEAVWRLFRLKGEPPVTRSAVRLIGEEVTVDDGKARRELGYAPVITREAGLAELRALRAAERVATG
jgi:nucleoside-diphosphate-sugar epimerase